MSVRILILIGTKKGAFIIESDGARRRWNVRGPYCETWPINHAVGDARVGDGTIWAGGGNEWFGPAVWKSTDLGESWTHSSEGPAYAAGDDPITAVRSEEHTSELQSLMSNSYSVFRLKKKNKHS